MIATESRRRPRLAPALALLLTAALLPACSGRKVTEAPPPERLYAAAEAAARSGGLFGTRDCLKAARHLDELRQRYPYHALTAEGELVLARCAREDGRGMEAIGRWEAFLRLHPGHRRSQEVRLEVARTWLDEHDDYDRDPGAASQALRYAGQIIREAPGSDAALAAAEVMQAARLELARRELYIARQYRRQGKLLAAAERYRNVIQLYHDLPPARRAQDELARVEERLGLDGLAPRLDGKRRKH